MGTFHSTKIQLWNFRNSTFPMERYILVAQTQPKPLRIIGYCSCKQDTEDWYWGKQFCQNGRGHFGLTHWNERTNQSEVPSKVQVWDYFPNISVRPNRTIRVCSIWFLTKISSTLGWMDSTVCKLTEKTLVPWASNKTDTFNIHFTHSEYLLCVLRSRVITLSGKLE